MNPKFHIIDSMIFLGLAVLCSSAIALIFKYAGKQGIDRYVIIAFNYATAVLISAIMLLMNNFTLPEQYRLTGNLELGFLIGIPSGVLFFIGFVFYQKAVNDEGVGLAGAFAKLGILVPMSLSLLFWKEIPTLLQWIGIALALASIMIVNVKSLRDWTGSLRPSLILLFITVGLAEFSNKIFQVYSDVDYRLVFLLTVFTVAGIFAFSTLFYKKVKLRKRDMITGVLLGVPNLFSSFFLIMALDQIKATIVFPIFAAGTIVVINIVGLIVFRERLTTREKLAIALTILAVSLIHLS